MDRLFNLKSLTLFVTIAGVVVPIWIWRADISSHSLEIRVESQVSLQPDNTGAINGLQISIDGVSLKSPYLTVLELANNGEKPILSSDFEAPLEIRIAEGSAIARAQITETKPKDVDATLVWEPQFIKIKPLLLNPRDIVTVSILTSGRKPEFTTRARIAGISEVSIDNNADKSTIKKALIFLIAALLLLIASSMTNDGLTSKEPLFLRRRAAVLVSISTAFTGTLAYLQFLEIIGVTSKWQIVLSFSVALLFSLLFAIAWNWNTKPSTLK